MVLLGWEVGKTINVDAVVGTPVMDPAKPRVLRRLLLPIYPEMAVKMNAYVHFSLIPPLNERIR